MEVLSSSPFGEVPAVKKRLDWKKIFSHSQAVRLERGIDFDCDIERARVHAHVQARYYGLKIRTKTDGNSLTLQVTARDVMFKACGEPSTPQ